MKHRAIELGLLATGLFVCVIQQGTYGLKPAAGVGPPSVVRQELVQQPISVPLAVVAPAGGESVKRGDLPTRVGDDLQPQTYVIAPGANAQFLLQTRLIEAVPGDTIQLEAGRYELRRQLDVVTDNVTILGRGPDETVLTFKGQTSGGPGIEATGNNFRLENLAIEDTAGNAVKVLGARNVTFRGVRTEWTGEPSSSNGAYGLYPVQCENVLMENCTAIGASDAGIYVGQCRNVILRSCRSERNVAGIEIENTIGADVYNNVATNNTGGLLVFDLPGLQQKAGHDVRVYSNTIVGNNHRNFADPGGIVAAVPPGTGVMLMVTDSVEVFDNQITDNQTASVLIVSYAVVERKVSDPTFDPIPEGISIHHNRISKGGLKPTGAIASLLTPVLGETFPDILWDGIVNPDSGKAVLHLADNGTATFANFNLAQLSPENVLSGKYAVETDLAAFATPIKPLAEISLPPHDPPSASSSRAVRVYRSLPKLLSQYGLFDGPLAKQQPAVGVVQYDLNTPLFSDYTEKRRFIRLPKGEQMQYRDRNLLAFPVGSLIAKTFSYPHDVTDATRGERLLETRIEFRQDDGWYGVTYVWNDLQTDAELVTGGSEIDVSWIHSDGQQRNVSYVIPNANQCLSCHAQNKAYEPIGPTARNLNRESPQSGNLANQLEKFAQLGMLSGLPGHFDIEKMPRFENPATGSVDLRARAWLEVNCAHCHNPAGTARTTGLDLRDEQTDLAKLGVWKSPVAAGHGSGGRKYDVVPGHPDESILMHRLESPDPSIMMPNIGRRLVHSEAVALIREWIEGMQNPEEK